MEVWNWLLLHWVDIGMAVSLLVAGIFAVMELYTRIATPNDPTDDEKVSRWKQTWKTWASKLRLGGKR